MKFFTANQNKIPINYKADFNLIIKDITENSTVQQMKNFKQHYDTSCYEHCLNVAYYSYLFCRKFGLDYISVARAGMLHDLFLYDWRKQNRQIELEGLHAFVHPKIALQNSLKLFKLNKKEQDIILKHMWPVTLKFPKYIESYVVTFTDKYSALKESFNYYTNSLHKKKLYKYAYVFLSLILFRIV